MGRTEMTCSSNRQSKGELTKVYQLNNGKAKMFNAKMFRKQRCTMLIVLATCLVSSKGELPDHQNKWSADIKTEIKGEKSAS